MKIFILTSGLLEILAGAVFFVAPQLIPGMEGESVMAFTLARMYGAIAIALGYYAVLVYRNFGPGPAIGCLKTYLVFNIGVTIVCLVGYRGGLEVFLGGVFLHAILAIMCLYFLNQLRTNQS